MIAVTDRLNILHLSDIHLTHTQEYDAEHILRALEADLKLLARSDARPHILVFSGDLAKDADDARAYTLALDRFLTMVMAATDIPERHIFLVPGNHDVQRSRYELHQGEFDKLDETLKDRDSLNEFSNARFAEDLIRLKFQNFLELRSIFPNPNPMNDSLFCTSYRLDIAPVSILLVNTAWMSTAGSGRHDHGSLLIPERSLHAAIAAAADTKKILVGHHPVSWLREHSALDIQPLIDRDIAVHLHGHAHKGDPRTTVAAAGQTYLNQSAALFTSRKMPNGYSVVSMSLSSEHVQARFRTYFDERKEFDAGINVARRGVYFSSEAARIFWTNHPEQVNHEVLADWITTSILPNLQSYFDANLQDAPSGAVFVKPRLSTLRQPELADLAIRRASNVPLSSLCQKNDNYIISSPREFGRTTCLRYIALRAAQTTARERPRVPAYINFIDVSVGYNRILNSLRGELGDSFPEGVTLPLLLQLGLLTILVDDVIPENTAKFAQLKRFMASYPKNQYVLCLRSDFQVLGAELVPELPLTFTKIFINSFSRNQIRQLVAKWVGGERGKVEFLLNRVISDAIRINIPVTGFTCSILLTIIEANKLFRPINRATVVQQYIETLLGRYAPDDAFRDEFDSTNKTHYLSFIAGQMLREDRIIATRDWVWLKTSEYMAKYAFNRKPDQTIELFVKARIFIENELGIQFRFGAFLEYFGSLQMRSDTVFYNWITAEERYLSYAEEIEFYFGIVRDDLTLQQILVNRLGELSRILLDQHDLHQDLTEIETWSLDKNVTEKLVADVRESIAAPVLSELDRDEVLQGDIPRDLGERQNVPKLDFDHPVMRWLACLRLNSRVVRNAELIPASVKSEGVTHVLMGWSRMCGTIMSAVHTLVVERRVRVKGVYYRVEFPDTGGGMEELLIELCYAVPEVVRKYVLDELGTEKLAVTLLTPLLGTDGVEPLIVTFFRKLLIADLKIDGYGNQLRELCADVGKAPFFEQALLRRLRFMFRTEADADQEIIRPILLNLLRQVSSGDSSMIADGTSRELERLKRQSLLLRFSERDMED